MKQFRFVWISIVLCSITISFALELGSFRLLSVAESGKLILVSQIPSKTKYIFDASSAKITVNGKPMEFQDLKTYSLIQVKFDLRKTAKGGIAIDGTASEIRISFPEDAR